MRVVPGVEPLLEVGEQPPAVAEPGEDVGVRLLARAREHPHVLGEGQRHAGDHAEDRQAREQRARAG